MGPLQREPIGLELTRTARLVSRAFDEALGSAGGSLPVWLVLLTLKIRHHATQRALAAAVGIEGPTLTHHLTRLEAKGLVARARDPQNRRVQLVDLTDEGHAIFDRLRVVVVAFDQRLRAGMTPTDLAQLSTLLGRLRTNVGADGSPKEMNS